MTIRRRSTAALLFLQVLFIISAFGLLTFKGGELDWQAAASGLILCLFNLFQYNILKSCFKHLDRFCLIVAQFLWSLGLAVIYRISPALAIKQFLILMASTLVMVCVMLIIRKSVDFGRLNWLFMVLTFLLLASTLVLGRSIGGAKNWIKLGFFTLQPSEFAKILYIMVSAYFLTTREKLVSFIPYLIYTAACVMLLVVEKDLGAGLLIALTFLVWLWNPGTYDYNGAGTAVIHAAIGGEARPEAFLLKMLFTTITLGAGFKGGEIVPVFFTGATFGCTVAPLLGLHPSFGAGLGMVSVFCGVTNCPLTSLLLALELFAGDSYGMFTGQSLGLFAVSIGVSYMLSGYYSLYSEQKIVYSKFRPEFINKKANEHDETP